MEVGEYFGVRGWVGYNRIIQITARDYDRISYCELGDDDVETLSYDSFIIKFRSVEAPFAVQVHRYNGDRCCCYSGWYAYELYDTLEDAIVDWREHQNDVMETDGATIYDLTTPEPKVLADFHITWSPDRKTMYKDQELHITKEAPTNGMD